MKFYVNPFVTGHLAIFLLLRSHKMGTITKWTIDNSLTIVQYFFKYKTDPHRNAFKCNT